VFTVNYLLYGVFLTDFVVVLLALLGLPAEPTAVARLIGTGLGAGLAIVAYLVWPTWEGTSSAEKFARLFLAQGTYASALLRAYTRPGGADTAMLRQLRVAARRVAQACLTLLAVVTAHHTAQPDDPAPDPRLQAGLNRLASGIDTAVRQIAAVLRAAGQDKPPSSRELPPLRQLQQAIWPDQPDSESADSEVLGLVAATDSLVDAVNTAAHAAGALDPQAGG
jgi:uncharacterized membrane protein YccC